MGGLSGRFAALALALVLAGPAPAQDAAAPDPAGCEFHVWPGDGLMSTFYGWFHGGIVNGAIQGRPGYPAAPPNPIDTARQSAILAEAEPQRLMAQADYRLVVHEAALPSRAIRTSQSRLADSASPCYAELIVDDVVLQQDFVNGAYLRTLFRYRDFGADLAPRRSFSTWSQTPLGSFPPRQPDQLDAAIAEIRNAFRRNIGLFAATARRPRRGR